MKIKELVVEFSEGVISTAVIPAGQNHDLYSYAFYLYRGKERVSVNWYSDLNSTSFSISKVGVYRVVGFLKTGDDVTWKSSCEFFYTGGLFLEHKKIKIDSLVESDKAPSGWYSIEYPNSGSFQVLLNGFDSFLGSKSFLVVFNGAVKRGKFASPPFFSGVNLGSITKLPVISIADPTLEINEIISLGWYAGNYKIKDLQKKIADLVDMLAEKINAEPIFVGGSGGGFAALVALKQSKFGSAVVWNPQTDIKKYSRATYDNYKKVAILDVENKSIESIFAGDVNQGGSEKTVIYLQNSKDSFHVERHARRFFNGHLIKADLLGVQEEGFFVYVLGAWRGGGHVSPPSDALISIIEILSKKESLFNVSGVFKKHLV